MGLIFSLGMTGQHPYKRTKYKHTIKPDASVRKEKILNQGKVVDRLLISNLLKQFEITYVKPTFDNIGISSIQKKTDIVCLNAKTSSQIKHP
jgi:hypothetical protein